MIKMRINNKSNAVCAECEKSRKDVVDMFDIKVGGKIFTLCDKCNEQMMYKCLHAKVYTNGRVKDSNDLRVINSRRVKVSDTK